mmetsp:Transcript_11266/g.27055  ORF Transcript_11266/g.27055 Transcript_11266/m.27055 type:complete len:302 (-) Transcript_11266:160-1065(-)
MEDDLPRSAQFSDLLQGLQRPDFVVDGHHANQYGIVANRSLQFIHIDASGRLLNRQVRHIVSLHFETPAAIEDALVLRLGRDDVLASFLVEMSGALDAQVVAFRRTGREDDLLRIHASFAALLLLLLVVVVTRIGFGRRVSGYESRDLRSRDFHGRLGFPAEGVRFRVGVPVGTDHVGRHGVEDAGIDRGRRRHVQVGGPSLSKLTDDRKLRRHVLIEEGFRDGGRRLIPLVGFHLFERNGRGRLGGEEATAVARSFKGASAAITSSSAAFGAIAETDDAGSFLQTHACNSLRGVSARKNP